MKQTVRPGRVGGITIGVHWSVGVILVVIAQVLAVSVLPSGFPHETAAVYWTVAVFAAALFLGSLLAHELAHALVARRSGVRVRSITLWMLGGVTDLQDDPPTAGADFRIAVAGPLTSLLAGVVFYAVGAAIAGAGGPTVVVAAAQWLAVMNGILAIFNLLPGAPLDGGRVLRPFLWWRYGDWERAERTAARVGQVLGAAVIGLGIAELLVLRSFDGLWLMLIGWFLISAAAEERQAATAQAVLTGVRVADVMTSDPQVVSGRLGIDEFIDEAGRTAQRAFPVVGLDGELTGVVVDSQLADIAASDRPGLRLETVALTVPPSYRAAPDDPAGALLGRAPLGGEVAAVVLTGGRGRDGAGQRPPGSSPSARISPGESVGDVGRDRRPTGRRHQADGPISIRGPKPLGDLRARWQG